MNNEKDYTQWFIVIVCALLVISFVIFMNFIYGWYNKDSFNKSGSMDDLSDIQDFSEGRNILIKQLS